MSKLDSQQVSQAFSAAIQQCDSWPKEILKQAKIDATCGLMEEFSETGGSSYLVASPRDQSGSATIRLNYESKVPISIVLNKRFIFSDLFVSFLFLQIYICARVNLNICSTI